MMSQKDLFLFFRKGLCYICFPPQKMSCYIPTCPAIIGIQLEGFCEMHLTSIYTFQFSVYLLTFFSMQSCTSSQYRPPCLKVFQELPILRCKQHRGSWIIFHMSVGEFSVQPSHRNSAKVESVDNMKGTVWPKAPVLNSFVRNMWIKTKPVHAPLFEVCFFSWHANQSL